MYNIQNNIGFDESRLISEVSSLLAFIKLLRENSQDDPDTESTFNQIVFTYLCCAEELQNNESLDIVTAVKGALDESKNYVYITQWLCPKAFPPLTKHLINYCLKDCISFGNAVPNRTHGSSL